MDMNKLLLYVIQIPVLSGKLMCVQFEETVLETLLGWKFVFFIHLILCTTAQCYKYTQMNGNNAVKTPFLAYLHFINLVSVYSCHISPVYRLNNFRNHAILQKL